MKFITKMTPIAAAVAAVIATGPAQAIDFEVWSSDQSNSTVGQSAGTSGSFLQIFEGADVKQYIDDVADVGAVLALGISPIPCPANLGVDMFAPCDANDIFPGNLMAVDSDGGLHGDLDSQSAGVAGTSIGRLHGALPDPQHMYVNVNLFAGGKGYVGIMTADTKEAIALWRVTKTNKGESLHMSFWSPDGKSLYLANLHGRVLERIDLTRDPVTDVITKAVFNQEASMGVGASSIVRRAFAFTGLNGAGAAMISEITGTGVGMGYNAEATNLITPNGKCRQNGCMIDDGFGGLVAGTNGSLGGRPGNVIVCPIVSSNNKVYVTFGGGGLLVADGATTPMKIVGEYGNNVFNGAGCGGVEAGGKIYLNAGASASTSTAAGAGRYQSVFSMYSVTTNFPSADAPAGLNYYPENFPQPYTVFKDVGNTKSGGMTTGDFENFSGQLPGTTNRRDAHGAVGTTSGHYIHNVDRILNNVISFDVQTSESHEYTLTNGTKSLTNPVNACEGVAADLVPAAYKNDVTPDLMDRDPNGDFLFFAARGPVPASVPHNAQGACPGVGVISLSNGGKSGELAAVVRTYNTTATSQASTAINGYAYTGTERSDPHGVSVVIK